MLWFLLTTGACNLKFRYCGGSFDQRHSTWRAEVSAGEVAQFITKRDPSPVVFFYGGEPLLNVKYILEAMEAMPHVKFGIQTNGLLAKRLPPEAWRRFSTVLLSIDGVEEVTDLHRGRWVYRKVVEVLKWLRGEVGCRCKIVARMTVSQHTDIYRDVVHLLGLGFDAVHWQLNVIWTDMWTPRQFLQWAEESYLPGVVKLRDLFLSHAERGEVLEIVPILGIYRALLIKPYDWVPCGAGKYAYAINTDGRVLHCPIAVYEKWAEAGHVKVGIYKKIKLGEKCARCEYVHICGGRCLYTHYEKHWGEEGFDAVCEVTKKTIDILKEGAPRLQTLIERGVIPPSRLDYDPLLHSTEVVP